MVRLPKHVAEAKKEFEQENDIKDAVNNPRKILKDSPAAAVLDYQNPQVALLCQKKLVEYNALALVVRAKILSLSPICFTTAGEVARLLSAYVAGLAMFPLTDPRFAYGTFGNLSMFNSNIPDCLLQKTKAQSLVEDIGKDLIKMIRGHDKEEKELIDDVLKKIKSKSKSAKDQIKGGFSEIAAQIQAAIKAFNDAFKLVQNPIQQILFVMFDVIRDFLIATGLGRDIVKLRAMYDCMNSYCAPVKKYLVDMEDLLPGMVVNLPIDQYSGDFRPYRLFIYSETYPDLATDEGNRTLSLMDCDYMDYCSLRKQKTQEIAQMINSSIDPGNFL